MEYIQMGETEFRIWGFRGVVYHFVAFLSLHIFLISSVTLFISLCHMKALLTFRHRALTTFFIGGPCLRPPQKSNEQSQ